MLKKCHKCGCEGVWEFGFVTIKNESKKRYKCKSCKYQFTTNSTREYSDEIKLKAMKMLKEGIGFRGIGRLLGVSFETIRNWAKKMAEKVCDVQIDEMCITIKKKN